MVKSKGGLHNDHIDNFLLAAEAHAHSGEKLARDVDTWVKRQSKARSAS
mgnify:CR=1 FL=1